ncbi:MAG: hypothetical protein EPN88_14245 [Bacteroidetes bacterium]|nr:MAG: hypothetical protein EPN88_14245 [Bacteroidota bacterium]
MESSTALIVRSQDRYITSNSIEEKIVRLQEKKSRLADTFISSNNPLKDLDIQEILNIIG